MKIFSLTIIALLFFLRLYAQEEEISFDTLDFESPLYYLSIDTSLSNIWEVCMPNKTFFDSAFSPDSAIVTNCTDYYPDNNHSWFDLCIGNFNHQWYPYDVCFEIKHKFDTEIGLDGGYITVSYDRGDTWMNIINDSVYFGERYPWTTNEPNLYTEEDTLFNGEFGFSGNSKDWVSTKFYWYVIPCVNNKAIVGDTMILRFNFISDPHSSEDEGWMIDDIRFFAIDFSDGINEHYNSSLKEVFPNPVSSDIHFKLDRIYQSIDAEILDMAGKTIKRYHFSGIDYFKLDCSSMKNGLYILKTTLNSKITEYKKIIVKR